MAYLPKTKTGQEIHALMGELSSAQHQWNTYATQLGRGYTSAYQFHDETVKKVQERLRLAAESASLRLVHRQMTHIRGRAANSPPALISSERSPRS
jgi:hypothetical protein